MKFLSGKLPKTAVTLGLAVAALTAVPATPASASTAATAGCTRALRFYDVQVQVDNCSDGWVWMYTGTRFRGATAYAKTASGQVRELQLGKNQASAVKYGERVTSIHVCGNDTVGWFPPIPFRRCSTEVGL
ncbi:hypothetical protein [Kitasatospora cathayae]|uniref:Secreted protein n=1 Tax=Kitasatospora cathayae TaxID=3004092 RepID=A0ABY7QH04_9ACTN|nr:hypothetical protein [Kitasatospora sp. HUAS 3-15]WBP92099.1 hypothetical protein O1G21_40945 [Kitasatospora sp. HUAS 3-15]